MTTRAFRFLFVGLTIGAVGLLASAGCSDSARSTAGGSPAAAAPAKPLAAEAPEAALGPGDRETWDVYSIEGTRVGYGRTVVRRAAQSGREVLKIEGLVHMAVARGGQTTEQDIRFRSTESPDGQLIDFESEIRQGRIPLRVTGRVLGDRLNIEMTSAGKTMTDSTRWSRDDGGPYAVESSLLRQPMKPGQRRTIRALDITVNQAVETELTSRDFEQVKLPGGTFSLLHVDTVMRLPDGQKIGGVVWTDPAGETLKSRLDLMNMEVLRVPKDVALAKTGVARLDLWDQSIIKLERPMLRAHSTRRVRYRVHLDGGDPAKVFAAGPSQQVKRIDDHTAEITVYAVRPDQPSNADAPDDPPTDADRQPNNFIESDDAKVVADAKEAAGNEEDRWRLAVALERYVHAAVKLKDFTQAFATAVEVARDRQGDCTEHAVYLAALARARDIPARVAVGLVYVEKDHAFGYHMWTEVHVDNRWIPIDGTLAKGGIGAAHLKVAHSTMHGAAAYSSFLPVVQLMGRLKIEALETKE